MSSDEENEVNAVELSERKQRKLGYRAKMEGLMAEYKNVIMINVDFVGSNQMHQVRIALRGEAVILMGKNTIMRRVIRDNLDQYPQYEQLLPLLKGNVGFVFTNGDLAEVRKKIMENKVPAAAKTGVNAPTDVYVPPGPTGLDPGQTAFFQALNIATKIARGSIEILAKVHLIKEGEKVTASAVALLGKLGILPFFYGITTAMVLDNGSVYDSKFLDMDESAVLAKFFAGVNMIAAISLEIGYPTTASVPHSLYSAFKKILAIAVATDYEFELAKPFKEYIANPDAFKSEEAEEEDEESEEESSEEESSDAGGTGGLFGDDSEEDSD